MMKMRPVIAFVTVIVDVYVSQKNLKIFDTVVVIFRKKQRNITYLIGQGNQSETD